MSLGITRYPVVPLSVNTGIVGWVHDTDTLHALIKAHRKDRNVPLNIEYNLLMRMAPSASASSKDSYGKLRPLQKLELFEMVMAKTSGMDLARVMHLHSQSNWQEWLARRSTFTRSLAVMSMVGYLLGLGDRHPSNLMIHRDSGKVVHIDFGDCWEVTQTRTKFPEKVPFRFTRMLEKAMELAGRDGIFRSTSETVMRVLREHRMSAEAMLGAFVHDPLINWRLMGDGLEGGNKHGDNDSADKTDKQGGTLKLSGKSNKTNLQKGKGASQSRERSQGSGHNPLQHTKNESGSSRSGAHVGSILATGQGMASGAMILGSVIANAAAAAGAANNVAEV